MKKIISLVLALTVVMSLAVMTSSMVVGASSGGFVDNFYSDDGGAFDGSAGFGSIVALDGGAGTYVFKSPSGYNKDKDVKVPIYANSAGDAFKFTGNKTTESISWTVSHTTESKGAGGMPTGINGEDLLLFRLVFDSESNNYALIINPVANPTVEYFSNVTVKVKIVLVNPYILTSAPGVTPKIYATVRITTEEILQAFDLANRRYAAKDAWKDATGVYRISAADQRPVVEAGVFAKAYGRKLIVDYPSYRVIFPTVKNQDIALNLQAQVVAKSTIALKENEPILTARFHDIYVKDKVQIEFKINADAQNYKGVTLYAYELNADNQPVKAKEVKVVVSDSATIVVEIPANTKLASVGSDVKLGAFGIYGTPQEGVKDTTTTPGKDTNPTSGPSDSVSLATAFAVISLAAAGFVAVGKAGKK